MALYKIYFKASVEKDFKKIPKKDSKKILRRIDSLTIEPRPNNCENYLTRKDIVSARAGTASYIQSRMTNSRSG